MPRNGEKVRQKLQRAALELYRQQGYNQTTAAEIAAKAGVTERTFFRHFPDKREVLFDGEAALSAILISAVAEAPPALGPLAALHHAFHASVPLLVENRALAEPRRHIIASSPALQEREFAKSMSLAASLASALRQRGVSDGQASLAAQVGIAAFGHAFGAWLDDRQSHLADQLERAFGDLRDLSETEPRPPRRVKAERPQRSGST